MLCTIGINQLRYSQILILGLKLRKVYKKSGNKCYNKYPMDIS